MHSRHAFGGSSGLPRCCPSTQSHRSAVGNRGVCKDEGAVSLCNCIQARADQGSQATASVRGKGRPAPDAGSRSRSRSRAPGTGTGRQVQLAVTWCACGTCQHLRPTARPPPCEPDHCANVVAPCSTMRTAPRCTLPSPAAPCRAPFCSQFSTSRTTPPYSTRGNTLPHPVVRSLPRTANCAPCRHVNRLLCVTNSEEVMILVHYGMTPIKAD